jgi:hypothetical protein
MGDRGNAHKILVGKPTQKKLGRPMHRWEDNIKMELKRQRDTGCDNVDSFHLAWNRDQWRTLVNIVMSLQVP